jgi:hypothetical protein
MKSIKSSKAFYMLLIGFTLMMLSLFNVYCIQHSFNAVITTPQLSFELPNSNHEKSIPLSNCAIKNEENKIETEDKIDEITTDESTPKNFSYTLFSFTDANINHYYNYQLRPTLNNSTLILIGFHYLQNSYYYSKYKSFCIFRN